MILEVALGCLVGGGATLAAFYFRKPPPPQIIKDEEEINQLKQKLADVPQMFEPLQKKLKEAVEKKESYKKLVEIHAQEIERLKQDNQKLIEEGLAHMRKAAELEHRAKEIDALKEEKRKLEETVAQLSVKKSSKATSK